MRVRPIPSATVVLLAAILVAPFAAVAVAQPPAIRPSEIDVEARVTELRARLALDESQVATVRVILGDARREVESLRGDAGATARGPGAYAAHRERRRAILYRVEDRIWAILDCAQKDAFRLYVRERRDGRRDRRGDASPPRGHRR